MAGAPRPLTDAFVQVPGARLFVRALGDGPTVIAVHGGPDFDHEYFRPELDVLAAAGRLVYYDQRGRGRSFDGEVPEVTVASEVADLDAVRASVGADRAVALGHSWGALVALEYAWAHPDRVSGLVLMNPAPISSSGAAAMRQELALRRTPEETARLRALREDPEFRRGDLALEAEYYRIHFRTTVRRSEQLDDLVGRLRRSFTEDGVVAARAIEASLYEQTWDLAGYDLVARLRGIDVPTLVISSGDDIIPRTVASGIAREMPKAELAVLADCGHFPYLERPDRVAPLVAALLARDTGPDR